MSNNEQEQQPKIDLKAIKERIAKLTTMTQENGCSEAEALNAANLLASLLDKHGLTYEEVKASQASGTNAQAFETFTFGDKTRLHEIQYCSVAIAKFFDCEAFAKTINGKSTISYFGYAQDVAAASSLTQTFILAMESDFKRWLAVGKQETGLHGKTLRKGFMLGFTGRIRQRLHEAKVERNNVKTTGTALVVLKGQLVQQAMKQELGFNAKYKRQTTRYSNNTAYEAGQAAGNRANIGNSAQVTESRKIGHNQ